VSARGRVRKLAPSGGWQTTAVAVARRVGEDEQEDAVEDEEVVREEDLSDEEADSAGPVKWVVPACKAGKNMNNKKHRRVFTPPRLPPPPPIYCKSFFRRKK
jgi:hypothetical protein